MKGKEIGRKQLEGMTPQEYVKPKTKGKTPPIIKDTKGIDEVSVKGKMETAPYEQFIAELSSNLKETSCDKIKTTIETALSIGYGKKITENPGFAQMVNVISKRIKATPEVLAKVEKLINKLQA